ncbi:hypothetical protein ACFX2J_023189 [Malus domestica]|uniref:lysine-rich arabinogalactan protein 17-like isoform X1 n=1 Tax=Malus domestica TaxID=3750 RepID=UPI0039772406
MERNNIFTIALVCLLVTGVGRQALSSVPTNSSATPAATPPATTPAAAPKPKSPFPVATPKSSPTPASALPKSVAAPTLSKSKKPKHKSPAPTPDVASSPAPEGPHASSSDAVFATVSLHSLQEEGEGVPDLKDNQGQSRSRRQAFKSFGVHLLSKNDDVVEESDVVIFSVKPQVVKDVVLQLRSLLSRKKLLVSIAADVKLKDL